MHRFCSGAARRFGVALLLATTALGGGLSGAGRAGAQETSGYGIPAGPLSQALAAFARQSGLQLAYDPGIAAGRRSPGLQGAATPEAALASLLAGTGLSYSFAAPGVVTITAPESSSTGGGDGLLLGKITLFGDRTATTLDESRASVAVVTGEPEAAPSPTKVADALRQMGNVAPPTSADSGFSIRGISSEGLVPGAADAPLASLYVDGIQQTVNAVRRGTRSFFDIEQLEVYRGPQSTLSGRAALAGAMYIRTRDPEFERSGAVMLSYGSDNARRLGLAFGDALGETLAYRVSAEWSDKDGAVKYPSLTSYANYGDMTSDEYYTLRAKVLWLPTGSDSTRVLLTYAHSYDSPTLNGIAGPAWAPGISYDDMRGDLWIGLSPYGLPLHVYMENRSTTVDNLGIEVSHDISDSLRFTALTSLSASTTERNSINDGMPYGYGMPDLGLGFPVDTLSEGAFRQRTFSQEFRLNYEDEALKWVAGLYLGRLDNDAWRYSRLPGIGGPYGIYLYDQSTKNSSQITNIALFGEANWHFAPQWSLIAGGRLDWIDQKQTGSLRTDDLFGVLGLPGGSSATASESSFSDTVFLPKLGLEYEFDDGQTVSLTYQQGYRPGGAGIRSDNGSVYTYDPEETKTLELAWRGTFMDDRLRLGANVFWQDWTDQQIEVRIDPANPTAGSFIANAGRSESRGAEIELAYAASDTLDVFGSVGLLKTRFKEFNVAGYGDYSGLSFPDAPEQSIALGLRWTDPTGWFAAASAKYTGTRMARLEQGVPRPLDMKAYTTVDAEFGYAWDQMKLTAYATNLFDEEYFVYESVTRDSAAVGDRREIGVRLDYRF